jgi:hypothetical protein
MSDYYSDTLRRRILHFAPVQALPNSFYSIVRSASRLVVQSASASTFLIYGDRPVNRIQHEKLNPICCSLHLKFFHGIELAHFLRFLKKRFPFAASKRRSPGDKLPRRRIDTPMLEPYRRWIDPIKFTLIFPLFGTLFARESCEPVLRYTTKQGRFSRSGP